MLMLLPSGDFVDPTEIVAVITAERFESSIPDGEPIRDRAIVVMRNGDRLICWAKDDAEAHAFKCQVAHEANWMRAKARASTTTTAMEAERSAILAEIEAAVEKARATTGDPSQ